MKKYLVFLLVTSLFLVVLAVPSVASLPSKPYAQFDSIERFEAFVQRGAVEHGEGREYQCYYEWDEKVLVTAASMANQDGLVVPETDDSLSSVSLSVENTLTSYEYKYSYKNGGWSMSVLKPSQLGRELLEAEGVKPFFESRYGPAYSELSECEIEIAGRMRSAYRGDRSAMRSVMIEHGSLLILFRFSEDLSDQQVSKILRKIQFRSENQGEGWIWIPVFLVGAVAIAAVVTVLFLHRRKKARALAGAASPAPAEASEPPELTVQEILGPPSTDSADPPEDSP